MVALRTPLVLGCLLAGAQTASASCATTLPARVQMLTSNAAALARIGVVRATAAPGTHVEDLQVVLERGARILATGTPGRAFEGTVSVRLAFKGTLRPGPVTVLAIGRQPGCASRRRVRQLQLTARALPVVVVTPDNDVRDGRYAVTVRADGNAPVSDLNARVLDEAGNTIAEVTRRLRLRASAQLRFSLSRAPGDGGHSLLVTGDVRGEQGRAVFARSIELESAPPPPDPNAGEIVQNVTLGWSGGRWEGRDSTGFFVPGIGEGQIVCRPDTQWVRFYPSDRSRDVAMSLWTFRDWGEGSEYAVRESEMTQFTGPDFNEGLNKFMPSEKRSQGSFVGLVGDGLPRPGATSASRPPTEIRVTWSWDFTDLDDASCSVAATVTSQGLGSAGAVARAVALSWRADAGVPDDPTATTAIPGLGTATLRCDLAQEGVRQLTIDPETALGGLELTTFEGSDRSDRPLGDVPYVVPLPNNGLAEVTNGAMRVLVASRWKVNDPDPTQNFCRLSAIAVTGDAVSGGP